MNNWDKELVQFKLQSKVNCTKFKMCHMKWSPEVGFWLSWHWLLARVKVYVMGLGPPNPCNLIRGCLRLHLFDPRCVSHSEMMIQTKIAHHDFLELATDAPALHCQHLPDLQKTADNRRYSTCLAIIFKILTREQERERNGIELIAQLNCHKEAILLQSMFNMTQLSINMTPSRKSWITPWTICLKPSVWLILHCATKENYLTT
jgi:hypothetical protein